MRIENYELLSKVVENLKKEKIKIIHVAEEEYQESFVIKLSIDIKKEEKKS